MYSVLGKRMNWLLNFLCWVEYRVIAITLTFRYLLICLGVTKWEQCTMPHIIKCRQRKNDYTVYCTKAKGHFGGHHSNNGKEWK